MALSDNERRLLEQMEAALAAEDPRLADTLRGGSRPVSRRRLAVAVCGLLVGLVVLVGGMELHPLASVVGFVLMLVSTIYGLAAWRQASVDEVEGAADGRTSVYRPERPDR